MGQTQTRKQKILGDVKKARRRRILISTAIIVVLAVSIVAAIIFLTPHPPPNPYIGEVISQQMSNQLSGISDTTLNTIGGGQGVTSMTTISGTPLTVGSQPEFLYVGADYCPYCAAERWSVIVALDRFGTFSGLTYMESSPTDVYPNTPTFSFANATYSSPYIAFVSVETSDRNGNSLQKLTSDQQAIINKYDCTTNGQCGGLAFIDIANQWAMNLDSHAGSQFSPSILDGVGNWTAIGAQLNNPQFATAKAVDGAANYIITAICSVTTGNPGSVCNQSYAKLTQAPIGVSNMPPADSLNNLMASDVNSADSIWKSSQPPI